MRKIALWNNYTCFSHNQMFNPSVYTIGEDLSYPVIFLKKKLEEFGFIVETLDMDKPENFEKIIFLDYPDPHTCCYNIDKIPKDKKYLILTECEMIYKENKNTDKHKNFCKVFSYNDNFISEFAYIKLNIPNRIKKPIIKPWTEKKFCTLIAGNKTSTEEGELYSIRLDIIHYLEKNHPNLFEFYGTNWDKKIFCGGKLKKELNRIHFIQKIFAEKHPCYKGVIHSKLEVLSRFKFSICYENNYLIPGYISEKIWDSFFAGYVPVYLGAPNILDYIPGNCFIDRRSFSSNEKLISYLNSINEQSYSSLIKNISNFLNSKEAYEFSAEKYTNTIINNLDLA